MIDDRIKLLAKDIADKKYPAIVIRNKISELLKEISNEDGSSDTERDFSEPIVLMHRYYGYPVTWIVSKGAKEEIEYYDKLKNDIYEIAKTCDCESCKKIKEMTYPLVFA